MKDLLLSEKYRPKTIDDMVLQPRIAKMFEAGNLSRNVIFYGHYGTGKTSLARILIGKYTKDKAFLEINSSKETSIDVIRTKVESFCATVPMGFDLTTRSSNEDIKYVFMDEYERMSIQAQDAMKVFVEEYSARNVRFILVTNHFGKISPGILSRFTKINFDIENDDERKNMFSQLGRKIVNIAKLENIDISIQEIKKIILKNAPDMRATLIALDDFNSGGGGTSAPSGNINKDTLTELFDMTINKGNFNDTYHFVNSTFGPTKIDVMISQFNTPFINYINEKHMDVEKLFEVFPLICKYNIMLDSNTDPLVIGISFVKSVREVFNI
jgi:DNA polymerase III delta prime subunit